MKTAFDVLIIGSGFSGMCAAIKLKEAGVSNFQILERDEKPGGTWWRNSYPGAAVDVQSMLYSFSFEPWNWSRLFAKRDEIYQYTEYVYSKHKLHENTRCQAKVTKATFDEEGGVWNVELNGVEVLTARTLITASGGLSQPSVPNFPGKDRFQGRQFHTSRWDNSHDHSGKRIAVIGTGASGIQVIPEVAKSAAAVYVLQRTPHWIMPRPDRELKAWERRVLAHGIINKMFRLFTYLELEFRVLAFSFFPALLEVIAKPKALKNIRKNVRDPQLQEKLIPDFRIGCKRILLSSEYYPSLNRDNVELVTDPLHCINESGIKLESGRQLDVDLIVYATGFHGSENNIPYPVIGREGASLKEAWEDGAHAYLGTLVPRFPNFFMMMGPNTGTGHTSVIYFIESHVKLIVQAIQQLLKNDWKWVDIRADVEQQYNEKIQRRLKKTVWMTGGCHSWYLTKSGKNTTLFPTFSFDFRRYVSRFNEKEFEIAE